MDENKNEESHNPEEKDINKENINKEANMKDNSTKEEKETNESIKKDDSTNDLSSSCQMISEELAQYDMSFKLIIIGDSSVGKSSITARASKNIFENYYSATVGFEFFTLLYKVNTQNVRLQIWDTCGQEEYRSLIQNFYRNASLAILVYSIDNKTSFDNLEVWLNEIKTKGNPDVRIFLVGNKNDLEEKREISTEEGKKFAEEQNFCEFIETSAKSGNNVQELFKKAAVILYKDHAAYKDMANKTEKSIKIPIPNEENYNILDKEEEDIVRKKKCCK